MIVRLVRWHLNAPGALFLLALSCVMVAIMPNLASVPTLAVMVVVARETVPPGLTVFEAALPIHGRDLVLARVMAALALVLGPVLVWGVAMVVRREEDAPVAAVSAVASLAALAVLAPAAVARGRAAARPAVLTLAAVILAGGAALSWLPYSITTTLAALGDAAALVVLGTCLTAAPTLAGSGGQWRARVAGVAHSASSHAAARPSISRPRLAWALLRSTLSWNAALFLVVLIAMGALGNATLYFCIAFMSIPGVVRSRTRWLAALPLSHRVRLLALVLPSLGLSVLCLGIGTAAGTRVSFLNGLSDDAPTRTSSGEYDVTRTRVSFDHWRRAASGEAPVIAAPWGERAAADTVSLIGRLYYNPFTTRAESSPRFAEWQFERATAEVYGTPLTLAQYDAGVRPRADADLRWWLVRGAAFLVLGLLLFLSQEPSHGRAARVIWVSLVPSIAVMGMLMYRVRHAPVVEPMARGVLRHLAHALPANVLLALPLAALPVVLGFMLLERQFARSELAMSVKPSVSPGAAVSAPP